MPFPRLAALTAALHLSAPLPGAEISWQAAADISGPGAILTAGTLVEAFNGSPDSGAATPADVPFTASDALLANGAIANALDGATSLDAALDELLTTLDYGGGTATSITVGGGALTAGATYRIQVFFTDLRACCSGRVMRFGDGTGNEVAVSASGGAGAFGQAAIGTFTADAATQTLSMATEGFGNCHLTAYQIRTAASAPVIGSFTATPALISSGQSTTLAWQITGADEASIGPAIGAVDAVSGERSGSPTETTTYTLTATNAAGSTTAQVTVGVDLPVLPPTISEFLASNDTGLRDAAGGSPDWIELHNPNPFDLDLAGYSLTDDLANPARWHFPAGSIVAGDGYLLVFASAADPAPTGELHAGFRLDADGGELALVAPDGTTVIERFADYPRQRTDVSYSAAGHHLEPTPGAPNGPAFAGFVADTRFDVDRGFFDAPFTVTVTSATPGATVVYTTDGTEPSATHGTAVAPPSPDTPGSASIPISGTTVLRAAALKDGLAPTDVDTMTYLFPADIIAQPAMDPDVTGDPAYAAEMAPALQSVRTLSIVTDPDHLFSSSTGILANTGGRGIAWERPVSIEFLDPIDPGADFQTDAGLRVHGNGSRGNPKNSLRLLFRGSYGAKKLGYPLFGEGWPATRFDTVVLRAQNANSWTSTRAEDRMVTTFLQDTFAKDSMGSMGHPTAGSTFVHLYLNGTYWGLYNPTERPDGGFGEEHFGGGEEDYDSLNRRFSVEVLSGSKTHWDEMIALSAGLLDSPAEYDQLAGYIDIDNLIDYMLLHQYMQTRDGPDDFGHNNMRLVRRNSPPGPFRLYPWDMEYSMIDSFGTRDYSYPFPVYSSPRSGARDITDSIASVYIRLKDHNPEFRLRYADRAYQHLFHGGALAAGNAAERLDARAAEIESAVVAESARWGDQQRATPYTRDAEWRAELERLRGEFFPARPGHVVSQLRIHGLFPSIDPPVFSRHGGAVPSGFRLGLTADAGTIHYTLDGSDPREAWSGSVNPGASSLPGGTVIEPLIVRSTAGWRYLDTGEPQSDSSSVAGAPSFGEADWKHPDFDDLGWESGTTPLGYGGVGDPPATTPEIEFGGDIADRHPTTYFRNTFTVSDAGAFTDLVLSLRRDDGAIAYLNGHEIARSSMPPGTVRFETLAGSSAAGADETVFFDFPVPLSPGLLLEGDNVLAVEVHQSSVASSDLVLDASLTGGRAAGGPATVPLTASGTVRARVLHEGEWSALAAATFIVGTPAAAGNLTLSELMYHPADGGEPEFLELANIGATPIDLLGCTFTRGVDFSFATASVLAPGARLVLTADDFLNDTALANNGERIALAAADGSAIFDFSYDDRAPWPTTPDGGGPSLTLIEPASDPDLSDPANWRPSTSYGGSPGTPDPSIPFAGGSLADYLLAAPLGITHDVGSASWSYTSRNAAAEASTTLEHSFDLRTWQPGIPWGASTNTPHPDGTTTHSGAITAPESFYMRLRFTPR